MKTYVDLMCLRLILTETHIFYFISRLYFKHANEPLTRLSKQGALDVSKEYLYVITITSCCLKMCLCLAGRLNN